MANTKYDKLIKKLKQDYNYFMENNEQEFNFQVSRYLRDLFMELKINAK